MASIDNESGLGQFMKSVGSLLSGCNIIQEVERMDF